MFRVTDEHKCKAIELCEARSEHPRTAKSIIGRASISIDDSDTTILTTCAQALQGLHTRPEAGATVSAHDFARLPTTTAAVSIKEDNDNGSGEKTWVEPWRSRSLSLLESHRNLDRWYPIKQKLLLIRRARFCARLRLDPLHGSKVYSERLC